MNNKNRDPWDMGVYRTGSVEPPKRSNPLVPILLVAVILLAGINAVLGIMNIRLTHKLKGKSGDGISMLMEEESTAATVSSNTQKHPDGFSLELEDTLQGKTDSLADIYETNLSSIVTVTWNEEEQTGIVLSADGYILTAAGEGVSGITARLTDEQIFAAELVGVDPVSDLAVLQVVAKDLIPAQFGNSEQLRVGDGVCSIGRTMTDGIVSAIHRDPNATGKPMTKILTSAHPEAGAPLFNHQGQIIGVGADGFAIPSTRVKNVVDQLIDRGYVSGSPCLGLSGETVSDLFQNYYGAPAGLYITQILAGSDAELKGLTVGDILLSINGSQIDTAEDLIRQVSAFRIGDSLEAVIYRNGEAYTITLTVEEAKE